MFARHGETDWNFEGRLQGHTDRPLNAYGREQAEALAGRLAREDVAAIYASDLARARETAEIVGERLGLPVVVDPDLREKNWGTWEGLTSEERLRVELAGESTAEHRERTVRAVERIVERHPRSAGGRRHSRGLGAAHPGGRVRGGGAGGGQLRRLGLGPRGWHLHAGRLTRARGRLHEQVQG